MPAQLRHRLLVFYNLRYEFGINGINSSIPKCRGRSAEDRARETLFSCHFHLGKKQIPVIGFYNPPLLIVKRIMSRVFTLPSSPTGKEIVT